MAVRLDANSESLNTTTIPSLTNFTESLWIYQITDRNTYSIITYRNDSGVDSQWIEVTLDADGVTLYVGTQGGHTTGSSLSQNIWYHLCFVKSGTSFTVYLNGVSDITRTDSAANNSINKWYLGDFDTGPNNFVFDGRFAAYKLWSVALTQAEILQEMRCYVPLRTLNLYRWVPMVDSGITGAVVDFSGNGRNFTATGTLTIEAGPPIPWKLARKEYRIPSLTGTGLHIFGKGFTGDTTAAATYNVPADGNITYFAGRSYLLAIANTKASSPAQTPSVGNVGSTAWTQLSPTGTGDDEVAIGGGDVVRLTLFTIIPAARTEASIAITYGGTNQTGCAWGLFEIVNGDTSNVTVQAVRAEGSSGTSASVTLSAFGASANRALLAAVIGATGSNLFTPEANHTELMDAGFSTPDIQLYSGWRSDAQDTTPSVTFSTEAFTCIGVELKALAVGGKITKNTDAFPLGQFVGMSRRLNNTF